MDWRDVERGNGGSCEVYQREKTKGKELRAACGTLRKSHLFGEQTQRQQKTKEEFFKKEKVVILKYC